MRQRKDGRWGGIQDRTIIVFESRTIGPKLVDLTSKYSFTYTYIWCTSAVKQSWERVFRDPFISRRRFYGPLSRYRALFGSPLLFPTHGYRFAKWQRRGTEYVRTKGTLIIAGTTDGRYRFDYISRSSPGVYRARPHKIPVIFRLCHCTAASREYWNHNVAPMNIIQVLRQYNPKSMERRGINLAASPFAARAPRETPTPHRQSG